MDKEFGSKGKGSKIIANSSSLTFEVDSKPSGKGSGKAGNRGSWIREDGAICFDNECITLKPEKDGALALTYDPDKCSCEESNDAILSALYQAAISGQGIRLEIKPKKKE